MYSLFFLNEYMTMHSYKYLFAFEWETPRMRICQSMIMSHRCVRPIHNSLGENGSCRMCKG